jgi:hypothetical protein
MFRKIGMNLEYVATDWGTVAQRFASHEPPEKGGWSMYPNYVCSVSMISPAANNYIRGSGPWHGAGYYGIDADPIGAGSGVTSWVDAGSAGAGSGRHWRIHPNRPLSFKLDPKFGGN